MDGQELVNITVLIAGRPFPLKVRKVDEPTIRQIAKDVNDKINHFQLTYKNKDKQDCLCMAALTYAVELQKVKLVANQGSVVESKLSALESILDQMLEDPVPASN